MGGLLVKKVRSFIANAVLLERKKLFSWKYSQMRGIYLDQLGAKLAWLYGGIELAI